MLLPKRKVPNAKNSRQRICPLRCNCPDECRRVGRSVSRQSSYCRIAGPGYRRGLLLAPQSLSSSPLETWSLLLLLTCSSGSALLLIGRLLVDYRTPKATVRRRASAVIRSPIASRAIKNVVKNGAVLWLLGGCGGGVTIVPSLRPHWSQIAAQGYGMLRPLTRFGAVHCECTVAAR
jgi:hypothetical protein